jgi:hypothetical protein
MGSENHGLAQEQREETWMEFLFAYFLVFLSSFVVDVTGQMTEGMMEIGALEQHFIRRVRLLWHTGRGKVFWKNTIIFQRGLFPVTTGLSGNDDHSVNPASYMSTSG